MVNQMLKIFGKSKHILFVNVIDKAFYFVLFLIIARLLSVKDFGDIILVFSVSNILLYVLQFGLPVFFQRQTAKEKRVNKSNLLIAVVYGAVTYVLSTVLVVLITGMLYDNSQYSLIIVIHTFVYSYFFISTFNSFLLGKGEQRLQFKTYFTSRLLTLVIIAVVLCFSADIFLFLTICLAGNIAMAVVFIYFLFKKHIDIGIKSEVSFASFKLLFAVSLPIGIAAMSNFLYDKIDVILVSKIIDIEQAAFYNIAYGIYKSSQLLFSFILVTGFSRVSSLSERTSAVKLFLKKYSVYILIISSAILISLLMFSKNIILIVYGDKYLSSVILLQILSVSVIPLALNNLTGITLNGLGMFRENLTVVLSALLINVILNVILLSSIGIAGAVYATILTELFILVFDLLYLKRKLW